MRYSLEYTTSAWKEFKALEPAIQKRIAEKVVGLADNPLRAEVRKLQGLDDHFCIRVGDYRVIYRVEAKRVVVVIVRISWVSEREKPLTSSTGGGLFVYSFRSCHREQVNVRCLFLATKPQFPPVRRVCAGYHITL